MLESVLSQPQPQGGDSVEEHPAGPCCCFPKVGRARGLGVHVSAVTGLQGREDMGFGKGWLYWTTGSLFRLFITRLWGYLP